MTLTRDFTPYDSRNGHSSSPVRRAFAKSWGAEHVGGGGVLFRLWAPDLERLRLRIDGRNREMLPAGNGWFTLTVEGLAPDTRYQFVMPDGRVMADPASRGQDGGVFGPSLVVDPTGYRWSVADWRGHAWHEAVLYELHIGTFTEEGTFRAAIARLPELASLGITMLQLMPVNQFPGERGWGYDGVLPYAPHHAYGTPDDMKALIDAAHRHGMSVMLDVVYNHLGPTGTLFQPYVPSFFDQGRVTPWGMAIDFVQPAVRAFFIENALYWLEEFNLDGLRMDAVDQINDEASAMHFLRELSDRVRSGVPGRPRHLVMEDHRNITGYLEPDGTGTPAYASVWNHDIHHAAHVVATGETAGYVGIFADAPVEKLAKGLAGGFIYQGEAAVDGEARGEPSGHLPPTAFVNFLQNHDQIGNRAHGERLISLGDPALLNVLTAMLILSPQVPMLFMGEEYGETQPFSFFCDYGGDLARNAWGNRLSEAENFGGIPDGVTEITDLADPNAEAVFATSKLRWERRGTASGRDHLDALRALIAKRFAHVVPGLSPASVNAGRLLEAEPEVIAIDWHLPDRVLQLRANLTREDRPVPEIAGTIVHVEPASSAAMGEGRIAGPLPGPSMVFAVLKN